MHRYVTGLERIASLSFAMSILAMIILPATVVNAGQKFQINEEVSGEIGLWTQGWYQFVEDGKNSAGAPTAGPGTENLNDFMMRRAYLYLKGQAGPMFGLFAHLASDRVGQEGLDSSGVGLGSGVAWRDLWISMNLHPAFVIQVGRMYVPLTRSYGTTSTKSMLTTDLPFTQGGVRGGIFYASKVGRDDGITFWGNPADGRIQYRLMVSEGVEGSANPEDSLRFAGRVSVNLFEAEKGWFNAGTYLGKKKVLAIGAGFDSQKDIRTPLPGGLPDKIDDNFVWTGDIFVDLPMADQSALTFEAAYVDIDYGTQDHNFSNLAAGDDGKIWYAQAGFLLPGGKFQPYVRYETVSPDDKRDTDFVGGGLNYYFRGHDVKFSLDYTKVDQDRETATRADHNIITGQLAFGF